MRARRQEPTLEERKALRQKVLSGELTVGESVRALRKQVGLTQREFAALVGVYLRVLQAVENDNGNPTTETLNKILGKFGLAIGVAQKRPPKPL